MPLARLLRCAVLPVVVWLSAGATSAADAPRVPTVVAFGDSTTAPRGPLVVYAHLLAAELPAAGQPVRVINAGVGGNTTDMARARFEHDVLQAHPAVVIIQFGINDGVVRVWEKPPPTRSRVSLERYGENLRYFVRTLRAQGARAILMSPNPLRWTPELVQLYGRPPYNPVEPDGFNLHLARYAALAGQVAAEEHVPFVDVYGQFQARGGEGGRGIDALLLDGMHPNAAGHRLIADWLRPLVLSAVRD